jgi:hypothetical protein
MSRIMHQQMGDCPPPQIGEQILHRYLPTLVLRFHLHQGVATVVHSQATNRLLFPGGKVVLAKNFICASGCTVAYSGTVQPCQPLFEGMEIFSPDLLDKQR